MTETIAQTLSAADALNYPKAITANPGRTRAKRTGRKTKTFSVEALKADVNRRLEVSTCSDDVRLGMASVLESVLHDTGNYHGYNYLEWLNGGYDAWVAAGKPADNRQYIGNESRRFYY